MDVRVIRQRFGTVRPATRCSGFDERRGNLGAAIVLELSSIWRRGETEKARGDQDFPTRVRTDYAVRFAFIRLPGPNQITLVLMGTSSR